MLHHNGEVSPSVGSEVHAPVCFVFRATALVLTDNKREFLRSGIISRPERTPVVLGPCRGLVAKVEYLHIALGQGVELKPERQGPSLLHGHAIEPRGTDFIPTPFSLIITPLES